MTHITQQTRKAVREALQHLLSEEEFWLAFDAVIEAEVAKAYCSLSFGSGQAYIYVGEGGAPEKTWRIDEINLWADYNDLVPGHLQMEGALTELAGVDAFIARLIELRTQIAGNIARAQP